MKSLGLISPVWWVVSGLLILVAGVLTGYGQLALLLFTGLAILLLADVVWLWLKLALGALIVTIPVSAKVALGDSGIVLALPAELLALALATIFLFRALFFPTVSRELMWRPLTGLIVLQLVWMLLVTLTSGDWMISGKRVAMHAVFVLVFYFLLAHAFRQQKFVVTFYLLFAISMIVPVLNTWSQHIGYGFSPAWSFAVTGPFFDDHTIYGACLAMVLPGIALFSFKGKLFNLTRRQSILMWGLHIFLFIALVLSFSRAAWLSVIMAGVVFLLIRLRISFRWWVAGLIVVTLLGLRFQDTLIRQVATSQSVSHTEDVEAHALSVTNIQTDNSNLERINRWKCALRMAEAKPILGWGPGMYQFEYGQFQVRTEMTYLSTFRGEKGNAHSEYLTALSETGWPGLIILLLLIGATFFLGLRLAFYAPDKRDRWIATMAILGLTTFFVHGLVNTFWDQVQMAILVFGSMAILAGRYVAIKEET